MKLYEHGTRARYSFNRCRCQPCRDANNTYQKMRYRIAMGYEQGPTVDAYESRKLLDGYLKAGYSERTIAHVCGISRSTIQKMLKPRYNKRGARTITRINAAKLEQFSLAGVIAGEFGFVPAAPIWSLVNGILATGMTKAAIARALGSQTDSLQLGHIRVGWRSAKAVCELYSSVVGGNPYDVGQSKHGTVSSADRLDDLLRDTLWGAWLSISDIIVEYQQRWGGGDEVVRRAVYRWLEANEGEYETRNSYEVGGSSKPTRSIFLPSPY